MGEYVPLGGEDGGEVTSEEPGHWGDHQDREQSCQTEHSLSQLHLRSYSIRWIDRGLFDNDVEYTE